MKNTIKLLFIAMFVFLGGCQTNELIALEYDSAISNVTIPDYFYKSKDFKSIPTPPTVSEGLTYELSEDGTYYIVSDTNRGFSNPILVIPQEYKSLPVKEIKNEGFAYKTWLRDVYLPSSICKIGSGAFNGSGLKNLYYDCIDVEDFNARNWVFYPSPEQNMSVIFGKNVKRIPARLFYPLATDPIKTPHVSSIYFDKDCQIESISDYSFYKLNNLNKISLPDSIVEIGSHAFYETGINELVMPQSLINIKDNAFSYSKLNHVKLNSKLSSLGEKCFLGCSLIDIDLSLTNINELPYGVFKDNSSLINLLLGNKITAIGEACFKNSGLVKIIIPDQVLAIGYEAFYNCHDVKEIYLGTNVLDIFDYAFYGLTNVQKIVINSKQINDFSIANHIFDFLGLDSSLEVIFDRSVIYIPERMFFNSSNTEATPKIERLVLLKNLKKIGNYAFFGVEIKTLDFEKNVDEFKAIEIGEYNTSLSSPIYHK